MLPSKLVYIALQGRCKQTEIWQICPAVDISEHVTYACFCNYVLWIVLDWIYDNGEYMNS